MSIEPFHINTENVNRFFIQGTLIERLHNNGIGQLLSRSYFWYVNVYWVVGIRPTLFTCIALLLVLHTSTSYIKAIMYILLFWKIQYNSFNISNMVSEPLLWPFLSSLVFISVTPFFFFNIASAIITTVAAFHRWTSDVIQPSSLGSGPATAVVKEFHTAQTTAARITVTNIAPIAVLKLPQRSSRADLQNRGRFNVIGDRTRPHAPLKVSERLITRHQDPPRASTRRHAPEFLCWRQP